MTKQNINIRLTPNEKNRLEQFAEQLDCSYAGVGSISQLLQLLANQLKDEHFELILLYLMKNYVRTSPTKRES